MKLLTENKKIRISEGLNWHITNKIPLYENVYRFGSKNYFRLFNEARKLYNKGLLEVSSSIDRWLMKTDIGRTGVYEGNVVMLDIPIQINEDEDLKLQHLKLISKAMKVMPGSKKQKDIIKQINVIRKQLGMVALVELTETHECGLVLKELYNDVIKEYTVSKDLILLHKAIEKYYGRKLEPSQIMVLNGNSDEISNLLSKYRKLKRKLNEAEYQGKDVELNKPKRSSGPKKYQVYVKNDKGNVIKVNFGDAKGGLTTKINNPEARKAFADRHDCKNKKDKTKAGYWSCNLPKYRKALGMGDNMNTYW